MRLLAIVFLLAAGLAAPAAARPPAARMARLAAGISVTNWFRFPPRADAAGLRGYLTDAAIVGLRRAGFTLVRLPVQPELLWQGSEIDPDRLLAVATAARRLQAAGLAVVIDLQPATWHLETSATDRLRLLATWARLAPALAGLDPAALFAEIVNEPVFADAPADWAALQARAAAEIRAALPSVTLVATGADWGGIDGLLSLRPLADPNVIYSVHFYEPLELTALAPWRHDVDHAALARLPFPAGDPAACARATEPADAATRAVAAWYCGGGWDGAHVARRLDLIAGWARAHDAVVWIGEFGATRALDAPARLAWLAAVREAAAARGIGWTLWGYEDVMGLGLGVPPPPRPALDPATRAALGLTTAVSRAGATPRPSPPVRRAGRSGD